MSQDRFLAILTMLYLNKNKEQVPSSQLGYDPLYKMCPVVNTLTTKLQHVYRPDEAVTLDEAICPFMGSIYFCVYVKSKPHEYRIKFFEMCKFKSEYVCTLEAYTSAVPAYTDFNSSFNVIDRLC
jgi:hypothetical protein